MMKRILLLSCLALLAVAGRMQAQCVTVDGIEYTVDTDGQTATVTGYTGIPVDVVIPATVTIDGTDYAVTSIGFDAFYNCDALQSVVLPEGLTYIGDRAFFYCGHLQSIVLPKSLQSIGSSAFSTCTALRSVTLPQGLQTIGSSAFSTCTALRSVTCHAATPPAIEESTFGKETYLTASLTVPQGAEAAYRAAEYWGWFWNTAQDGITYGIHNSGQSAIAFYADPDITAANIPATMAIGGTNYSVTAICSSAFSTCTALRSVTLPQGLQTIGSYAFTQCYALQSITLPQSLQSIGRSAFYNCSVLQSVTSHADTPPAIAETTFSKETYATASLTVPQGAEAAYRAAEYWGRFYHAAQDGITYGIHDGGQSAIALDADDNITTAAIPATVAIGGTNYPVTAIGTRAFYQCSALQGVTLPDGLQTIGHSAFYLCESLQSITLPQGLQSIGDWAFARCTALQSIDIPQGVTEIGHSAFYLCESLQSIILPDGLQTIGESAFFGCNALQSITLPQGLQTIGDGAFYGCDALQSIISHADTPPAIEESTFGKETYATATLAVPQGAEAAYRAAEYWGRFYNTTIDGITYMRHDSGQSVIVFYADPDITAANIPATVSIGGVDYPVTAIGEDAFLNCGSLQSITLPQGLQTIGNSAFQSCNALQSVTLPQGLQTIGENVFYGCYALQSVTFPQGLQAIGDFAFYGCSALQSVTFPQGLQTIGSYAFHWCSDLQSITLPEGLQSIGSEAFYLCYALQSIISHADTPPAIEERTFDKETYATATLTVPQGAEAAYRAAEYWGRFYNTTIGGITYGPHDSGQSALAFYADPDITAANIPATVSIGGTNYSVTAIGYEAFAYCDALRSVTLPQGLQTIGSSAFNGCTALQSVAFPEGLQAIGQYAFQSCYALQSITLPQGLQAIGDFVFYGCDALQSVTLPEGLQSIGGGAFNGCTALQSITLPSALQSIGMRAFQDCPLTDVYCHAATPPAIRKDTFDEETYAEAMLHVPSDVAGSYQAAQYWKQFQHIVGDLPSTAISSVATDASLATYANGILTTSAPAAITVYAQSGAQVRHAADATTLSLAGLPRGIYIIGIEMDGQRQVMKVLH